MYTFGAPAITTTRVFRSGNNQAVHKPKESRVKTPEIEICRRGEEIVLRAPAMGLERAFELLTRLPARHSAAAPRVG